MKKLILILFSFICCYSVLGQQNTFFWRSIDSTSSFFLQSCCELPDKSYILYGYETPFKSPCYPRFMKLNQQGMLIQTQLYPTGNYENSCLIKALPKEVGGFITVSFVMDSTAERGIHTPIYAVKRYTNDLEEIKSYSNKNTWRFIWVTDICIALDSLIYVAYEPWEIPEGPIGKTVIEKYNFNLERLDSLYIPPECGGGYYHGIRSIAANNLDSTLWMVKGGGTCSKQQIFDLNLNLKKEILTDPATQMHGTEPSRGVQISNNAI